MAFLELPRELLIGLGFGVAGVSFWVVGILGLRWLFHRYGPDSTPAEGRT